VAEIGRVWKGAGWDGGEGWEVGEAWGEGWDVEEDEEEEGIDGVGVQPRRWRLSRIVRRGAKRRDDMEGVS
jgi:hypothetical protein